MEVGDTCARASDPLSCMESYGFECFRSGLPDVSLEAQSFGCNLRLGDGRYHFVQLFSDNGGWNVSAEETYWAEQSVPRLPEEDSALALSSYIEQKMKGYWVHSSGGGAGDSGPPFEFSSGARRDDGHIEVRAACGAVFDMEFDESLAGQFRSDCEGRLLRTVKKLSQAQGVGSYRIAAPTEFAWEKHFVNLVSGDTALVLEGRYTFADEHTPCLWISNCCSRYGSQYLDSCRTPDEIELQVIQNCLSQIESRRSDEFMSCLRASGVMVGCEDQADGSQLCF